MAATEYDVIVIGAGNAALSAVHAASESGVRVCVLEKAPEAERGGNSALTAHFRFAFDSVDDLMAVIKPEYATDEVRAELEKHQPSHPKEQLWDEVMTVTEGLSDQEMLRVHVDRSYETIQWLHGKGHDWIPTYENATTGNIVSLEDGGLGLQRRNFAALERIPTVTFRYGTAATELVVDSSGAVTGVVVLGPEGYETLTAKAIVLACGGFEANPEMRARYLGPRWDQVHNRGVPYNTGDGLRMALDIGAMPYGGWSSCHASPNDWAMPSSVMPSSYEPGGWHVWARYLYPFSIMVNTEGDRFVNEADEVRALTYAKMGRAILAQPGGKAFQVIDAKVRRMGLVPGAYDEHATAVTADSLEDLAKKAGIDPAGFLSTVERFNAAVPADRTAQPHSVRADGVGTTGITPPKSNFAMTIDEPPFEAYAVRCGMTFTFGGVRIDPQTAQVQHVAGRPIPGLFAAGEIVGGLWYWNYPSGSGMMAGATFGRIAGESAARLALAESPVA